LQQNIPHAEEAIKGRTHKAKGLGEC